MYVGFVLFVVIDGSNNISGDLESNVGYLNI